MKAEKSWCRKPKVWKHLGSLLSDAFDPPCGPPLLDKPVSHLHEVARLSDLCSPLKVPGVPNSAPTCNKLGCSMRAAATTGTNGGSNLRWPSRHKQSSRCHPPQQNWGLREALRAKACVPAVGTCPGHDSCHIPTGPEAGRMVRG